MRGITTLINTRELSFHRSAKTPKAERSREQFSVSPQLVALSLLNARYFPASGSAEVAGAGRQNSGCSPGSCAGRDESCGSPRPRSPWFAQAAPRGSCSVPNTFLQWEFLPLHPLQLHKHKHNLSIERGILNQCTRTESKLFKVKVYLYFL